jgi:hypothetical protein
MKLLITIILNLPSILKFISEIEKMIKGVSVGIKKKQIYNRLTGAVKKARKTGDTSEIENIVRAVLPPNP